MSTSTGFFVWYDYNAKDVDAAKAFYTETIGWSLDHVEAMDYNMWGRRHADRRPDEASRRGRGDGRSVPLAWLHRRP